MLPSKGRRIATGMLSVTLVLLLVMNIDMDEYLWKYGHGHTENEFSTSGQVTKLRNSKTVRWKPETENHKTGSEKIKTGTGNPVSPFTAGNKMETKPEFKRWTENGDQKLQNHKTETIPNFTKVKNKISPETEAVKFNRKQKTSAQTCQPKKNIVFIKTFKTASSTLNVLLSRFAMKNNLSIHGHEGCLYPDLFYGNCPLPGLKLNYSTLGKSNIIADHISYDRTVLSDVMPEDTIYVTMLRQPLDQLISRLNFRGYSNVVDPVKKYKNMKDFGASTEYRYQRWDSWRQLNIPHNVISQEFPSFLTQLEKELDLVTITEQFDLSLLLLRRKLCWDISDMLYMKLKAAKLHIE